jgi:CHAP domain
MTKPTARRRRFAALTAAAVTASLLGAPAAHAVGPGNELTSGQELTAGQSITSPAGEYQLTMQSDGNLVEYFQGQALWASGTSGTSGAYVLMQGDGNLVIYGTGGAVWTSGTAGNSGAYLNLQDDANLVLYSSGNVPLWLDAAVNDTLTNGQELHAGQSLESGNRSYQLLMQDDGNLVLYGPAGALWASGTPGTSGGLVLMQGDGNLVLYGTSGAVWSSGTAGNSGAHVLLQNDGNFVLYGSSGAVWSTGTAAGATLGNKIATVAESQVGYGDSPSGTECNKYSAYWGSGSASCGTTGNLSEEWCADFAAWVWRQAGVSFTWGSDLNAGAASFYSFATAHGTWHWAGSGYTPQPGDAAVYGLNAGGTYAAHVAIVIGSGPDVVNGDWWQPASNGGVVEGFGQTSADPGMLSGYASP